MSSMDGDIKKDILDVRKVIERSTSKVSLRDLEKKGFRKVKVLRAGDINQLIYKAVQTVLAKQPGGMQAAPPAAFATSEPMVAMLPAEERPGFHLWRR